MNGGRFDSASEGGEDSSSHSSDGSVSDVQIAEVVSGDKDDGANGVHVSLSRPTEQQEEDAADADHIGIVSIPRWRQRRRQRQNIEYGSDYVDEDHHDGESRLKGLVTGEVLGRCVGIGNGFRHCIHTPRRRIRSLSLAVYIAACGTLLMYGQMDRMAGVAVPDATISNPDDTSPWDQGDEFRDRGPRPKRKKIKQVASAKGKHTESFAPEAVDAREGKGATSKGGVPFNEFFPPVDIDPLPQFLAWRVPHSEMDVPVLWRVPRSAGTALGQVMTRCYGHVLANEVGAAYEPTKNGTNETLRVVTAAGGERFVNVDTTSREGLKHAKRLRLASSGLADAIITPYLFESAALFAESLANKGRCFALLRHPIDRAVSMFHHLRRLPSNNGTFANMTMEEYARGSYAEENWMVRFLSNRTDDGVLRWADLELAKGVLARKCFVGILGPDPELFLRSLDHFRRAFRWDPSRNGGNGVENCIQTVLREATSVRSAFHHGGHRTYERKVWDLFVRKNGYDLRLFERALELFEEQRIALNITYYHDSDAAVGYGGAVRIEDTTNYDVAVKTAAANVSHSMLDRDGAGMAAGVGENAATQSFNGTGSIENATDYYPFVENLGVSTTFAAEEQAKGEYANPPSFVGTESLSSNTTDNNAAHHHSISSENNATASVSVDEQSKGGKAMPSEDGGARTGDNGTYPALQQ